MKYLYAFFIAAFFCTPFLGAQSPDAINYQAVARDGSGAVLSNQNIGIQISIFSGSPGGTLEYQETHSATTNQFGLFNLQIGTGTVASGTFSAIGWGTANHYVQIEMDPNGGTAYQNLGTQQLVSVPYALYANRAAFADNDLVDDADADSTNEIQMLSLNGDTLSISGGNSVTLTDNVDDADADSLNEIQTLSYNNDTLYISGGNSVYLPAGGGSQWVPDATGIHYVGGNVGVGVINPNLMFVVGDTGLFRASIGHAGNFNESESGRLVFTEDVLFNGTCGFEFHHDGAANTLSLESGCTTLGDTSIVFTRTGEVRIPERVRIGSNANPSADIHLEQSSAGTSPGSAGIRFYQPASTTNYWTLWNSTNDFSFAFNGTRVSYINTAGQYIQASDARLKHNVIPLTGVLSSVLALRPVKYEYTYSDQVVNGFLAQEVEQLFPELVVIDPETGLRGIDYNAFGVLSIQAIREQQQQIDSLNEEVDELKAEMKALREAVESLKD